VQDNPKQLSSLTQAHFHWGLCEATNLGNTTKTIVGASLLAKAVSQSMQIFLMDRFREQARSHRVRCGATHCHFKQQTRHLAGFAVSA